MANLHTSQPRRILVIDSRVGIPLENLTLIFAQGFTTRKGGQGGAFHCGAPEAKEMGGSLPPVHCDGVGLEATFTLELPINPVGRDGIGPLPLQPNWKQISRSDSEGVALGSRTP